MARVIDYYFATISPWSWLGHDRLVALARAHGASVRVRPVDFGRVFPASGGLPLPKRAPHIALGKEGHMPQGLRSRLHRHVLQATIRVRQRTLQQVHERLLADPAKLEDLRAREERCDHAEERILCGGANKHDAAILHIGQQRILLGAVETVQLVDEEDDPAGRRYWQFIRAHTVNVLVEAPVEAPSAPAPQEPKAQAAPPPEPSRQRQAPPEPRAQAPRPQHTSRPTQLRPSRPSRADGKDDQATRNRASCIPTDGFETHFESLNW